jgi:hypothetical protein
VAAGITVNSVESLPNAPAAASRPLWGRNRRLLFRQTREEGDDILDLFGAEDRFPGVGRRDPVEARRAIIGRRDRVRVDPARIDDPKPQLPDREALSQPGRGPAPRSPAIAPPGRDRYGTGCTARTACARGSRRGISRRSLRSDTRSSMAETSDLPAPASRPDHTLASDKVDGANSSSVVTGRGLIPCSNA